MQVDITEYTSLAHDASGARVAAGLEPALRNQQVTPGASSAQSEAVNESTRFVRVHTDVTIRISFGADPVASGASQRMVGNSTEFFGVGRNTKIAVIQSA